MTSARQCLIFAFLAHTMIFVSSQELETCRGVELTLPEDIEQMRIACLKEIGLKSFKDTPDDKKACLGKCVFQHEDLIDDKGAPNRANIFKFAKAAVPADLSATYADRMTKCVDDFGGKVDPTDKSCESYNAVTQCMHTGFIEICHS